jgi:hypothetical protein
MADKTTLEQMLEHLVNDDQAKAEELFHEYVVAKSREVYESLIEEELKDEDVEEASEKDEDESVDEASKDEDSEEDKVDEASDEDKDDDQVDEEFEEVAVEGDDEEGEMDAMGGDATDDLEADITGDDEEGEKEPEELFQDLDSIVDELQAKFDEIKGGDEEGEDGDMKMGDEEGEEEAFAPEASTEVDELATMREYVEKVAGGHGAEAKGGAESADNKKSPVAGKNDMGGTAANIAKGGEESGKNDGGLADITPKEDNAGNVNTPGSKNATKMDSTKGHGAEKAGSKESADNKQSIFRGRR